MTLRFPLAAVTALLFAAACRSTEPVVSPASISTTSVPTSVVVTGTSAGVFAVKVTDAGSNPLSGLTVNFLATGSGTVSPPSAVTDANGLAQTTVTASGVAGSLTVTATVSGTSLHADVAVTVLKPASNAPCTMPAVGSVTEYSSVLSLCLTADANGGDYTIVAFNSDTLSTQTTTILANGVGTPPTTNVIAPTAPLASRAVGTDPSGLVPDLAFHARLRRQALRLTPLIPAARQWQAARIAAGAITPSSSSSGQLSPSGLSRSAIPSNPQVGDLLTINTDVKGDCSTKDYRGVRITAIGTHSVVMADTANPAGGFTTADYQSFAAKFDTLIFPLDSTNFGAPTDIDGNHKVGILFTRAVNEATPANSSSYIAGFFADRDLFPKVATARLQACPTSNEAEMFYMLAPDPTGVVNGNVRPTSLVVGFTPGTLAHEFQHLINAGRRLYVNTSADFPEVTWLNEGLSHEAEELLYYRESGRQPRQNLTDADIRLQSSANYQIWKDQQSQNFQRYASYLSNPGGSSPMGVDDFADDSLSTRGGIWSFLRYAADRLYTTDGTVWFRLVNSTTTGLGTLRSAYSTDPVALMRDWSVANYFDDNPVNTDPRYQQLSWNYHDIYMNTFTAKTYPLKVTGLTSGASVPVSVKRTSASFYRLTVPASGQAVVNLTSTSAAPPAAFRFQVIRTR